MRHRAGHFWPYSAWEARVNGALASKLNVHINIVFIIVTIIFLEFTGTGKGQWPSEWGGPVSGELLYTNAKTLHWPPGELWSNSCAESSRNLLSSPNSSI